MTAIGALWLPILLSSVIVFAVSSLIHMFTPWHKGDYGQVPNEDRVMDALRPFNVPPGDYMIPRPSSMKDMSSPAFTDKMKKGPVMIVTVMPNAMAGMAKPLLLWFVYSIVVGALSAYVAGRALDHGAAYLSVFRFAGATAFIAYSAALWQHAIWYHRSLGTTFRSTVDGLVYGLLTAGTFGWLWPH